MNQVPLSQLEARLGMSFREPSLLEQALTHRSTRTDTGRHYERLEFLGDAVLDLVVSQWLMERYPASSEGELSRMRSELVNRESLAQVGSRLALEEHLRMGPGERREGRGWAGIIGDVFEAVTGAIFLDQGFEAARDFVLRELAATQVVEAIPDLAQKDAKSRLQEWTQSRDLELPRYALLNEVGPEHNKTFTVRCELIDGRGTEGQGPTKKSAEQNAARALLIDLGEEVALLGGTA